MIESFELPKLRDACNKFCIPNVLCPFGCSSFIHQCGHVSLDITFQCYFPKCVMSKHISNKHAIKYILPARDDYVCDDNDYDCWLLNSDNDRWFVQPLIAFVKGVPVVMTCDDHDQGTTSFIIHPPRSPSFHNLSSKYSDQLSHCSI